MGDEGKIVRLDRDEPDAGDLRVRERRLVGRARDGDADAWALLYREHLDPVFRYLVLAVYEPLLAEELAQETFARAIVSLPRFRGECRVRTWLIGIANNLVRNHLRREARSKRALERHRDALGAGVGDCEADVLRGARARALSGAMEALPVRLREIFTLVDLQQLPVGEAAELLGITSNNASVRLHRARRRIRDELAAAGWFDKSQTAARGNES